MKNNTPSLNNNYEINKCANRPCNLNCDDNGKIISYASNIVRVTGNWPTDLRGVNWQP